MSHSDDFKELFASLNAHGVRALVVGGHAFAYHARPRYRSRRVEDLFDDQSVAYLSMEDLLRNKEAAGRPQDLADVAVLKRMAKKSP